MIKKSYKLNNENKLNNKSELQSKSDSVILTNYKKNEEDSFVKKTQEKEKQKLEQLYKDFNLLEPNYNTENASTSLQFEYDSSNVNDLQEKLEKINKDLGQFREKLENERKHILKKYTNLIKVQEVDKKELEKINKDLGQFREKLEKEQEYLSEMYTNLERVRKVDKEILGERIDFENSLTSSQFEYDSLNEKELWKDNKDYILFKVGDYKHESLNLPQYFFYDSIEYDKFEYDSSNEKWSGEELEI